MADINYQRIGKDPLLEMDFAISIEGVEDVGFKDFSGIKHTHATAEYRTGDGPPYPYKQDGGESVEDVTLSRGVFKDDKVLKDWHKSRSRKVIDIVRLKHDRSTTDRDADVYRLYEARCTSLDMGKGDASSGDSNAIQEIVITYEDVDFDPDK